MGIPLIGGLIDGGSSGEKKRQEEERRKAEEAAREAEEAAEERRAAEAEAAEERQAELEAAAEERRESSLGAFERRQVREDERGAPIQRRALESIASQRDETPETPRFQMTIPEDEVRFTPTARVLEDEIQVTPNRPEPQADPYARVLAASAPYQQGASGGRAVDFDALDAQQDAADAASASQARANLGGAPAPMRAGLPGAPQPQSGTVAPPQTTPTPPASGPAQPPGVQGSPSSPLAPPAPPAAAPLPQQQRAVDARQQTIAPQGSRLPPDVRTAAMPQPSAGTQRARDTSSEDEARTALRRERILTALGYITKLGLGAGALALDARGGSPAAAQFMAGAGGMVGNAMIGASPTQQQARVTQARGVDEQRARTAEDLDLRRITQAAQERRAQMLEAQQAQRLDIESRRVGAMEEGLGLRAEQTQAQAEAARALAAERASRGTRQTEEAALDAARRDPGSEVSRQAQRELRVTMQAVPEAERIPDEEIDMLSGEAAEMLNGQFARRFGLRTRAAQRGGGGGMGGAPMSAAESRAALVERGLDPALADSLPPRELARLLRTEAQRSLREGITAEGREILPGVFSRMEMTNGEVAKLRDGFASMRDGMLSLNRMSDIAAQFGGASARISPQARAAITPELTLLRSMVAQMGNTGVIQPSEVPTINAALPNPGDLEQMTFGSFDSRLSQWQRIVSDRARSALETRGVDGPQVDRALRALRVGFAAADRGEGAAPRRTGSRTIRVTNPETGRSIIRPDTPEERARAEQRDFDVEEL